MKKTPQLEQGFVQIATGNVENDIFSALAGAKLHGSEYAVVLAVIRKTWGWKKREDMISLSQFEKITGLDRTTVCRAIKSLVARRILVAHKTLPISSYGLDKRFDAWVVARKPLVAQESLGSGMDAHEVVACTPHTKETLTKETIQKKPLPTVKGPRPSVDLIIRTMKEHFAPLDGTEKKNRQYAWLLIQRTIKNSPGASEDLAAEQCAILIRAAARHEWWGTRIKKVETLYKNTHMIYEAVKEKQQKTAIIKIS